MIMIRYDNKTWKQDNDEIYDNEIWWDDII